MVDKRNIFNANDTLDINELASLNDDISPEFIEQLQNQLAQNASDFAGTSGSAEKDVTELFEEPPKEDPKQKPEVSINENIDDNFMKKYKAKLNKQQSGSLEEEDEKTSKEIEATSETASMSDVSASVELPSFQQKEVASNEIGELTSGNIIESPASEAQLAYNESLDYIDDNVKYSKYVIYIDPENKEFIDSLTVKERKNLINRILKEQDNIAITKRRLSLIQTVLKHSIVAVITISIAIPAIYWTVNASLEASIDNYRRSKTAFQSLYREKGKLRNYSNY